MIEGEQIFRRLLPVQLDDSQPQAVGDLGDFGGRPVDEHPHDRERSRNAPR